VISLEPLHQRLVMHLDPSAKHLFAAGHSLLIYVFRLSGATVLNTTAK